jgi:hypothetical protein
MKIRKCCLSIGLLLAAGANAHDGRSAYRIWAETSMQGETWTVVPHVAGPDGSVLSYRIVAAKSGRSGRSDTRQSGTVALGPEGSLPLGLLRIRLGVGADCVIEMQLFDGTRPVANLVLKSPS